MTGARHPPRGGGRSDAAVAGARAARMPGGQPQDPSWDPSLGASPSSASTSAQAVPQRCGTPGGAGPGSTGPCRSGSEHGLDLPRRQDTSDERMSLWERNTDRPHTGPVEGSPRSSSATRSSWSAAPADRQDLPVQEQHRLGRQLLRLPRELPGVALRRVPAAGRRADPVLRHPPDPLRGRQGAGHPPGAVYCIAQRAEHIWEGVSSATTRSRPIINTRDEPHADAERYRRLHVIVGDSNMSEGPTFLKVGATDLVLRHGRGPPSLRDLTLENPIRAIREISHDMSCRRKVRLANGRGAPAPWRSNASTSRRPPASSSAAPDAGVASG